MAMQNVNEIFGLTKRGGCGYGKLLPKDGISVSLVKSGGERNAISIGIGEDLMRDMRWVTGDKVTIEFDSATKEIKVRRVISGENIPMWTLSSRGGVKGARPGRSISSTVKVKTNEKMSFAFGLSEKNKSYSTTNVKVSDNGFTFKAKNNIVVR